MEKPTVHVFAAYCYDQGHVWGTLHLVSLETAEWMRELGYWIIGPDPHDMIELAKWEKEQESYR
jgi:hypothetical protein